MDLDKTTLSYAFEPAVTELVSNECYSEAINLMQSEFYEETPNLLKNKAFCYMKLNKIMRALEIVKRAEEKSWCLSDIEMIKGQCLYQLQEWETALTAFKAAEELKSSEEIKQWITRCVAHLQIENGAGNFDVFESFIITDVKKECYQKADNVVVRLLVKEVKEESLEVVFDVKSIDVRIKQKKPIVFHMDLQKEIIPSQSSYIINNSSVELSLKKADPTCQWHISEID